MVPAAFVVLDRFPMLKSGKVDRASLPIPASTSVERVLTGPSSDLERRLERIWADVLGMAQVGVEENFFDLGGNSLSLLRIHNRLCAELGRRFPVATYFQFPTIRSLATWLGASAAPAAPRASTVNAEERRSSLRAMRSRRLRNG
jgi:hypothetical protein